MQRNKRQGILMSAGVLGIGAVLGFSTVASADDRNKGRNNGRSDAKNDRRDDRWDNRQNDRRGDDNRRDDHWDNRRDDHRDNRNHDKHDKSGKQNNGNHYGHQKQQQRPDWNRGQAPVYRPQYNPPVYNPQYNPGYNPGYNPQYNPGYNPQYNPGYGTNPQYNNGGWSQQNVTLEGTIISDGRGNGFTLRAANGQTWVVQVQGAEPADLSRGDVVRVFGPTRNNTILATGMRILQNR